MNAVARGVLAGQRAAGGADVGGNHLGFGVHRKGNADTAGAAAEVEHAAGPSFPEKGYGSFRHDLRIRAGNEHAPTHEHGKPQERPFAEQILQRLALQSAIDHLRKQIVVFGAPTLFPPDGKTGGLRAEQMGDHQPRLVRRYILIQPSAQLRRC